MIKDEKKDKNSFYLTTKSDIIFISLIVLLSVFVFLSQGRCINRAVIGRGEARVYINGVLSDIILLKPDRMVDTAQGKWQLEVRGGRVRVLKSDCPHKICAHTGWVSEPAETLLCVPNKILLEIDKEGTSNVDAVAY